MKDIQFQKEIIVTEEHLDMYRHVNNVQYVHWVEDIATAHWDNVRKRTSYADCTWVMVDHHIQYRKQLVLGDRVTIITYPQPPEGIRQPRKVEFYRGGELVAVSRTLWILLDAHKKIVRLPHDWLNELL